MVIRGLRELWARTRGHSDVLVAVLDGVVDQAHPCFAGAALTRLPSLVRDAARPDGQMSVHATHVASVLFGQHGSPVMGIAPECRGLIVPIYFDDGRPLAQLDLARAIEQAIEAGAHVINVSGGQLSEAGEAEDFLTRAVRSCRDHNVLLVAAAGNDGCACLHVPAALPSVLAVGAMDAHERPLPSSNWGETYRNQGILAPGQGILGALPGGGTGRFSGTSFATAVVSGVASLLLSLQRQRGDAPDPWGVRHAILHSALPCTDGEVAESGQCLVGKLNIPAAFTLLLKEELMTEHDEPVESAESGAMAPRSVPESIRPGGIELGPPPDYTSAVASRDAPVRKPHPDQGVQASVLPNGGVSQAGQALVYAVGTLGYDFGTEARRDSFKQLMPAVRVDGVLVPSNPYESRHMVEYLGTRLLRSTLAHLDTEPGVDTHLRRRAYRRVRTRRVCRVARIAGGAIQAQRSCGID